MARRVAPPRAAPPSEPVDASPPSDDAALAALVAGEVVAAARGLLGCRLVAGGRCFEIVETEAYHEREAACHAYQGRTPRAEKLRRPGGTAYVYLSYGIHRLLNVVTGPEGEGAAVLIRGVVAADADAAAASADGEPEAVPGPGRVGTAAGLTLEDDGAWLLGGGDPRLQLLPATSARALATVPLAAGPRVGISKAVELPWRFVVVGSPGVSSPRARMLAG